MQVTVKLFGAFRKYGTGGRSEGMLALEDGARVKDVVNRLCIPDKAGRVTLVNGRPAADDQALAPDDEVVFLSPLEGG